MKHLLIGVLLLGAIVLGAAPVDFIMTADIGLLMKHPQFQEIKKKFGEQGEKSLYGLLTDESIPQGRLVIYANLETKDGVLAIDMPEGAGAMMEQMRKGLFADGGTPVTVGGCPGFTGAAPDGTKMTVVQTSPRQLQFVREGSDFTLPFLPGKVNKQLLLAAQKEAILSLHCVPAEEALRQASQTMPFLAALKVLTASIEGTVPEATFSVFAGFQNPESAQMAKMMLDMTLGMLQQNNRAANTFLAGLKSSVDGNNYVASRVIDKEIVAMLEGMAADLPVPGKAK